MTEEQLKQLILETMIQAGFNPNIPASSNQQPQVKRYVYGLRGIRELFNVSHVTAQQYKNTFLAPAVMQRGRKIIVDADMAIRLYNQRQHEINHLTNPKTIQENEQFNPDDTGTPGGCA